MNSRIYDVCDVEATPPVHRLVEAASQAQAIRHVVSKRFIADVAKQQTLVELLGKGVKVEVAGSE